MKSDATHNLVDTRLEEFKPGQSLYCQKTERGFSRLLLCEFIRIDRGIVIAKVVGTEEKYLEKFWLGKEVRVRKTSCMLWGKRHGDSAIWARCHWYSKEKGWT